VTERKKKNFSDERKRDLSIWKIMVNEDEISIIYSTAEKLISILDYFEFINRMINLCQRERKLFFFFFSQFSFFSVLNAAKPMNVERKEKLNQENSLSFKIQKKKQRRNNNIELMRENDEMQRVSE
jgi:hypothetical protein